MPRRTFPADYRRKLVELFRSGRSAEGLAKEFGVNAQTIRNWARQADVDEGKRKNGLTSEEREELQRLRRENRVLREEREILKKAAAWFAQETNSTPKKGSSS
jgi:transposase